MRWRSTVVALFFLSNTLFVWAAECPEGSMPGFPDDFTADCYLYERFPTQFVTAERLCRQSGGNLVSIFDGFVNTFVAQGGVEAFLIMERKSFWIGGHNLHNDTWQWVDDQPWKYTKWDNGQPSNSSNHCVAMHLDEGIWKAEDCFNRKPYVCAISFGDHHNVTTPKTTAFPTTIGKTSTPQFETTFLTTEPAQESTKLPSSTVTETPIVTSTSPDLTTPQESTKFPSTSIPVDTTTLAVETTLPDLTTVFTTETAQETTLAVETTVLTTEPPQSSTKSPSTSIPVDTTVLTTELPQESTKLSSTTSEPSTKLPSTIIPVDTTTLAVETTPQETTLAVEKTVLITEPPQSSTKFPSTSTPQFKTTFLTTEPPQESTKLSSTTSEPSTKLPSTIISTLAVETTVLTTEPPQESTKLPSTSIRIDTTVLTTSIQPSTESPSTSIQPSTVTETLIVTSTTPRETTSQPSTELPSTSVRIDTTTSEPTTKKETTVQPTTKKATTSEPTTTIDPTFPCPANWLFDDDFCYYPIISTGWLNDQATCQSLGANLVSIHSKVQNAIITLISNKGKTKNKDKEDISIGLREIKVDGKRQWSWTDKSKLTFTRWDKGFDTTPTGSLKCATYHLLTGKKSSTNGVWRYVECDSIQSQAICMTPADYKDYSSEEKDLSKYSNMEGRLIKRSIPRSNRLFMENRLPENFSL